MSWLPSFYCSDIMMCRADGELEGWTIGIEWGSVTVEFSFARRLRWTGDGQG